MKYILTALMALSIVGCATTKKQQPVEEEITYIYDDKAFDPYLQLFKSEAARYGINIRYPFGLQIKFAKGLILYGIEGRCLPFEDKLIIEIDKHTWDKLGHMGREELMFHELGHCVLQMNHNDETTADGRKMHLMHSTGVNRNGYAENRDYYVADLFNTYKQILIMQQQMMMKMFQDSFPAEEGGSLLDIIENPGPQNPSEELEEELNNKTNL